jgi:hypothetical protein
MASDKLRQFAKYIGMFTTIADRSAQYNINPNTNYKRFSNGDVLSAKQVTYLLELAKPAMQAIILLDIYPTDAEVTVFGWGDR